MSDCDCENYDIDTVEDRCSCRGCGRTWRPSEDELLSAIDDEAYFDALMGTAAARAGQDRWWRNWWSRYRAMFRRPKPSVAISDDDIPF